MCDGLDHIIVLRRGNRFHHLGRSTKQHFQTYTRLHGFVRRCLAVKYITVVVKYAFNSGRLIDRRTFLAALHSKLRSEEHTSELQSRENLVCRLLLEKKKKQKNKNI